MSLLNKDKADLDKDGKLSSYEQKRGEAIEKSMREKKSIGGAVARALSKAGKKAVGKEPSWMARLDDPDYYNDLDDVVLDRLEARKGFDDMTDVTRGFYKSKEAINDLIDGSRDVDEVRALLQASGFSKKEIDRIVSDAQKASDRLSEMVDEDSLGDAAMRAMNKGGYVDDMERLGLAQGNQDDGGLRQMLVQKDAMGVMQKSPLDDVAYDQMIMDLEENPDLSGFRKMHSEFDRFIQDKESKAAFLNLLKNRDEIFEREEKAHGGAMVADEDMEENFVDYIIKEALPEDKQMKLKEQLEANPDLSELFDEVVIRASEFTGAGSVDGPGTGTSDDIPARLSDGEFVFTAKAVEQIGADKLMKMMKDAEAAYDDREAMYMGGLMDEPEVNPMQPNEMTLNYNIQSKPETVSGATPLLAAQEEEDIINEEIKKGMLGKPNVRS